MLFFSCFKRFRCSLVTIQSTHCGTVTSESTYPRDEEFFVGGQLAVNGL